MLRKLQSERSLLIVCIALGLAQAWISRYAMNPDGMSYLDIGDAYFRGDWPAAINGYWSPLYSWWLGLALYVLKPSIWWEFVTVHLANLAIYIGALFSFRFFLHSVLRAIRKGGTIGVAESLPLPECVLVGLGYGIYLWVSLVLIDAGNVTPDLLVAAIFFLIGGYLVQLRVDPSYGKFAMFGVLCGLAYLGKTIMFPVGFGLLAILLFSGRRSKRWIGGFLLAGFLFIAVSAPFIAALSKQKGRFTYGDTGRLAYASMVSPGAAQFHWQGEPAGSGTPLHTTRLLLTYPRVFEFAKPVGGTYPPWYDPSYWNAGVTGTFRMRAQLRVIVQSSLYYIKLLTGQLGLVAGVLIFLYAGGAPTRKTVLSNWPLIAAACLSLGAYAVVLVRARYVGASLAVLFVGVLAGVRLPQNPRFRELGKFVAIGVMVTILFSVLAHLADEAYTAFAVGSSPQQKEQLEAAAGLRSMGVQAGDRVAVIGDGTTDFWARLGRFKVVSEIYTPGPGRREFWAASDERKHLALQILGSTGAKLVVAWSPPLENMDAGWKRIADTNYYAFFLNH